LIPDIIEYEILVLSRLRLEKQHQKKMARKLGGRWDPEVGLWYILFKRIKGTDLEKHIALDASLKNKNEYSI